MGAWGIATFENDDASDWLYDLEASPNLDFIQETLTTEEDYLEAPEGSNIIAAAEILLALRGQTRAGLPENAKDWVREHSGLDPSPLIRQAIAAVQRVLGENSELRTLWEESGEFDTWKQGVEEILTALAQD